MLIFENVMLYNMTGTLDDAAGAVDIDRAAVRREGRDVSLITYGGSLWKTLEAAEALSKEGIEAEVIDLRSLRPLDDATIMASIGRTRRAVIIDEGWLQRLDLRRDHRPDQRTGLLASRRAAGTGLRQGSADPLSEPPRSCIDPAGCRHCRRGPCRDGQGQELMSVFVMPSLGADMEDGKLVEWLVKPGDAVHRGDVVAVVETQKGAIEIEIFEDGIVQSLEAELGATLPVGATLALIGDATAAAAPEPKPAPAPVAARPAEPAEPEPAKAKPEREPQPEPKVAETEAAAPAESIPAKDLPKEAPAPVPEPPAAPAPPTPAVKAAPVVASGQVAASPARARPGGGEADRSRPRRRLLAGRGDCPRRCRARGRRHGRSRRTAHAAGQARKRL